jgi:hypothetical protein
MAFYDIIEGQTFVLRTYEKRKGKFLAYLGEKQKRFTQKQKPFGQKRGTLVLFAICKRSFSNAAVFSLEAIACGPS